MSPKNSSPKASSWDKLSQQKSGETHKNRDVFEAQQLDRSQIEGKQSKLTRTLASALVALVVAVLAWSAFSVAHFGQSQASAFLKGDGIEEPEYYDTVRDSTLPCYQAIDAAGERLESTPCYDDQETAVENPPQWYLDHMEEQYAAAEEAAATYVAPTLGDFFMVINMWKVTFAGGAGLVVFFVMFPLLMRNLDAQNLMHDTADINQYQGDQHIAIPEEIQRKFSWFPDVGAHSSVQPSSMISHVMLTEKGLKKVTVSERAEKDLLDEDGDIEYFKGEILRDEHDNIRTRTEPIIDEAFGDSLFKASGLPMDKANRALRKKFDATKIDYNPGGRDRDKFGSYDLVSDFINDDWIFPEYETQRPGGAYLVDESPVNTMVLAITRAGKGQTYIEPILDMWLREKRPNNMVINDPKGELLVKNYVRATMRGYQVVQFNLINAMKTDIYNPLGMAAEAAREGDSTKCALYVENIADVFFPIDGGDDPVWPNAANNAFKRAAYGLIDYYLEEERELRNYAVRTNMEPKVLETELDARWGRVTLYNCYQLFVQLSSKKIKNPMKKLDERVKADEFGTDEEFDQDEYEAALQEAEAQEPMWDGNPEMDMLTLYFNGTARLPQNSMRTLVGNADNALKAMAGAEKMLASVYGIAITAMSFFTDPTISTLTSGRPSQNTDLGGLSFPRRMGVRFGMPFMKKYGLMGSQAIWDAWEDKSFTKKLDGEFEHDDIISREGWARYYFKGLFPGETAYLRLRLQNPQTGMLKRTFFFEFTKEYQTSLDARRYIKDPITKSKIVKNGLLMELKAFDAEGEILPGDTDPSEVAVYGPGHTTYNRERLTNLSLAQPEKEMGRFNAIISNMVRYSDSPKAVFLVTPPHLSKYSKLILILLKQLVDLNFDKSYMTKSNQKPLYKTRFMLDELGNLQSEGTGISGFETMLSIGLGQEQQFTLILQTLQQLRDVYGESVDKIVQGNCLPLTAKIATPSGWTTMGEVEAGDEVLTPFGTATTVTEKFPVKIRPVYRLTLRDGSSVEACPDHLWPVERWKSSIKYLGGKGENGKRLYVGAGVDGGTAERVTEIISTEELKTRIEKGRHVDLIPIAPVAYPKADLAIDPYVLGVILGDCYAQINGVVKLTCKDTEIVDEIRRRGHIVVDDLVHGERKDGIGYRINGVNKNMRELGLAGKRSWEKSIPESYLLGSVEQRTDLLRGLMDTDGTISGKGEMEFTSASPELAEGVQTLVRSLGGRVNINVKTNVMYTAPKQLEPKAARDAHRVQNIRLPDINPFGLARKAERWKERTRSFNRVISVEYVRDDQVQCIQVADERHLYLTDDFIPTHNTSNIVFLKSTDDSMIETLEKMSGKTHVTYRDSKTVTKDMDRVIKIGNIEGKVSYTMNTKEEPVIKYNDLAFLSERNSIVFRAGDPPVWNRNETILPMSFALFKNAIQHPGHEYSLQTIPTLSSAMDFDVRQNQPDFEKMLAKRMKQAVQSELCKGIYREAYGYEEIHIERLDPDVYADEVMELVDVSMREDIAEDDPDFELADDVPMEAVQYGLQMFDTEENVEQRAELAASQKKMTELQTKRYARGMLSREDMVGIAKAPRHHIDEELVETFKAVRSALSRDTANFRVDGSGSLRSADSETIYILKMSESEAMQQMKEASQDEESRVYSEGADAVAQFGSFQVTDEFYLFLAELDSWLGLGDGEFDKELVKQMTMKEDTSV